MQVLGHSTNLSTFLLVTCFHVHIIISGKLFLSEDERQRQTSTFQDSAANRTESASHERKHEMNLLLKLKAKCCLSRIHGGHYVSSDNRRKLACILCLFFSASRGNREVLNRGSRHGCKALTKLETFTEHLGQGGLTLCKNAHFFLNTCAELISEFRNAPESWNNEPIMEALKSKTWRERTLLEEL